MRPQRRRRGGGRGLPRRQDPVHDDRRGGGAHARGAAGGYARPLRGPLRGGCRGSRPCPGADRPSRRGAMSYVLAAAGFAALIILHELGHFTAAKAVGMRVERFYLFFPPAIAKFRRGETEYGVGAIPLGGFVKISGMNPDEELPPEVAHRAYYRQPVWKRIVTIAAGPAMNLLIAFVLLFALAFGARQLNDTVGEIVAGSPAATHLQDGRPHPGGRRQELPGGVHERALGALRAAGRRPQVPGQADRRVPGQDPGGAEDRARRPGPHLGDQAGVRRRGQTNADRLLLWLAAAQPWRGGGRRRLGDVHVGGHQPDGRGDRSASSTPRSASSSRAWWEATR